MSSKTWPALSIRFTPASAAGPCALEELLSAALDDFHPTAIQEHDAGWRVFFASAADRDRAEAALPTTVGRGLALEPIDVEDEDWARRSQETLGPVSVGRVIIAPPWNVPAASAYSGRPMIVVRIQPSMGFGTGHHASTRLCTALLQRVDLTGRSMLDVGTGSGVLAIIARRLGADTVLAVDDDPDALESTRENVALNGMVDEIVVRQSDFRALSGVVADVVTANLTGGLLVRGAAELAHSVLPAGMLIVSGVTLDEEAAVRAAFQTHFDVAARLAEDEWVGLLMRRRP
ncbi:MAG TPA: 50S ribosomal protein L11 methyltransferase [Vicinamibacterales bacterium]|jgi:ribosomal protein L11 methyltransferase